MPRRRALLYATADAAVLQRQFLHLLSAGFAFENAIGGLEIADVLVVLVVCSTNWSLNFGTCVELSARLCLRRFEFAARAF